jgi:lipopolysaccharide heptosyltransferase II
VRRRSWTRAERVLCVRLDTVGDVLMTTPAMRALKHTVPGRSLTLLTSSAGADVTRFIPEVDEVIVYDAPWLKATTARTSSAPDRAMIDRLRAGRFDAAVMFTVYSQSALPAALLCYLSDIPLRLAHCRENPYLLLTDWIAESEPDRLIRHEAQRQLDLVASIGATTHDRRLSFLVPHEARLTVERLLAEEEVDTTSPWVVVHPGASAPSRRYSARGYAAVADGLIRDMGWQVVFTGSTAEVDLVAEITSMMAEPAVSVAGRLGLGELGALIDAAPVVVSNNTAPVHIAAAVGTPVVDVYALTNPQHTPWEVESRVLFHDVPCKFCYKSMCPEGHHNCLELVAPQSIVDAAAELVGADRPDHDIGIANPPLQPS